jgi:hypothetical protein
VRNGEALLLIFGVLGLAEAAFQWTVSPWFVALEQSLARWLVEHDRLALLDNGAPWWLLTHYPQANDVMSWLDGLCIVGYLLAYALVVGSLTFAALEGAVRLAGGARFDWKTLAMALVPAGGVGLFLGLSMLTLTQLRAEHVIVHADGLRAALLVGALAWSAWLGARILWGGSVARVRRVASLLLYALPLALTGGAWWLVFWRW